MLRALSEQHQRAPAQILFRYLTVEGVVPLSGTQADEHMHEDLAIFDFALSDEERAGSLRSCDFRCLRIRRPRETR